VEPLGREAMPARSPPPLRCRARAAGRGAAAAGRGGCPKPGAGPGVAPSGHRAARATHVAQHAGQDFAHAAAAVHQVVAQLGVGGGGLAGVQVACVCVFVRGEVPGFRVSRSGLDLNPGVCAYVRLWLENAARGRGADGAGSLLPAPSEAEEQAACPFCIGWAPQSFALLSHPILSYPILSYPVL
jgi:hypothetical protein